MTHITVIGIDLAKNSFQVYAQDSEGNPVFNKAMTRKKLLEYMNQRQSCLVGMEASGTAHYFARTFEAMGHKVKLIHPRQVKAYVVRNKTDAKDAEAIAEATVSKKVKGIAIKSVAQQEISHLHKARSHVIKRRVCVANHLRSQLAEYGVTTKTGAGAFNKGASFAAFLGLTPKESSSGQKRYLGAMSKQGDRYLRTLLIHGARTVIQSTLKKQYKETRYHQWILSLVERIGKNKAAVALANKHARMLWAIMTHTRILDLDYDTQTA